MNIPGIHWWLVNIVSGQASYQIRKIADCACAGNAGNFSPPPRVSDSDMHHGTCVTHVPWCMSESQTSDFLWSRWRGKRTRHSRCMRNPQFCVSGKRPMAWCRLADLPDQRLWGGMSFWRAPPWTGALSVRHLRTQTPRVRPRTRASTSGTSENVHPVLKNVPIAQKHTYKALKISASHDYSDVAWSHAVSNHWQGFLTKGQWWRKRLQVITSSWVENLNILAGAWRNDNVIITSKRRCDVVLT